MADATIGALRVVLGADTGTFEDGLKRAQSSLSTFAKSVGTIAAGIGLERIIEKSVESAVHAVKEGFQRIDAIGKEAQKTGIGVEAFSGLILSAELADVSMQTLSTSLGKLSKNMVETSQGTGEAQKTFEALGISVKNTDGTLKSADQVLIEIAGKFEQTSDGATKTAAAIALLGRSGKELIPLLNAGAAGLEEMRATAERMGLVIDKNTAYQVERFNDNLKILGKTQEGITNLVIQGIIPALVRLSDMFVESATKGDLIRTVANAIINEFKALVIAVNLAITEFGLFVLAGKELFAIFSNFPNIEKSAEALNNLREITRQWGGASEAARDSASALFVTIFGQAKTTTDQVATATSKFSDTIASFALRTAVLRGEFALLAPGFAEQAVQLKLTDAAAQGLSRTVVGLTPAQQQLNAAMLEFQGARIANEALNPWERLQKQIAVTNAVLAGGKATNEEIGLIMRKTAQDTEALYVGAAKTIADNFTSAFATLAQENKKYAAIAKAAAIAQATINTYEGATKAYATLGPFGPIAAAAIIAAGFALIAKMIGVGLASGGSFRVGGGLTGVDSEMIAFRATPGEIVDVRRPGQDRGGGVQTINLGLPSPNEFFTQHVREMVNALNRAAPDGYILKVAPA